MRRIQNFEEFNFISLWQVFNLQKPMLKLKLRVLRLRVLKTVKQHVCNCSADFNNTYDRGASENACER
jgi:hypothetical protein